MPIGIEVLLGNAELFARDRGDALQLRCLCDFDVRRHGGGSCEVSGAFSKTGGKAGLDENQLLHQQDRNVGEMQDLRSGGTEQGLAKIAVPTTADVDKI